MRITVRLLDLRAGNQVVWAQPVRPPVERPAVAAGRDRLRGGGADRSGDPADRGQAQRQPPAGGRHRLRPDAARDSADRPAGARALHAGRRIPARAIELEPEYAAAHAWYAYWQMFLVGQDWADDPRCGDGGGRPARRTRRRARPVRCPRADHRRPCAGLPAPAPARSDGAARAGTVAQSQPGDGLGALGDRLRLYGRSGGGGTAEQPLQEAVAARSARILLRRLLHPDPSAEARLRIGGGGRSRGERDESVILRDLQAVLCRRWAISGGRRRRRWCGGGCWRSSRISLWSASSPRRRSNARAIAIIRGRAASRRRAGRHSRSSCRVAKRADLACPSEPEVSSPPTQRGPCR